ncbi:MAG: pilus assembly protein CpaE [Nocardioides sp.]
MIRPADARQLRAALGRLDRPWQPRSGDRFCIPDRDLDDMIFVVAEMTIEVEQAAGGPLVRFNGTTEWALDTIAAEDVLWLPWEHQLRELLGARFASLEAPSAPDASANPPSTQYAVTLTDGRRFVDRDPERAYLAAVLDLLDAALLDPALPDPALLDPA